MGIREKLVIRNFFSILNFEWDVKGFNVLTGGMATGKSIALKLLYFCEQIIHQTILDPSINKDIFEKDTFFKRVEDKFYKLFKSNNHSIDFSNTMILYIYSNIDKEQKEYDLFEMDNFEFDLLAQWNRKTNRLQWSSKYIESKLEKWQKYFDEPKTPDFLDSVRNKIFESLYSDFSNDFPLAAMFIPASRAIAAIANSVSSQDQFINGFMNLRSFTWSFHEIGDISSSLVNEILHLKNISIDKNNKQPAFELFNDRIISSLELSSGQQELLYLLLLINDLKNTSFKYGKNASIFIEEPSAHLFPKEQKETIEFLVTSFNSLTKCTSGESSYRFFISTHSPYVLNTINNILEKGRLLNIANTLTTANNKKSILEEIENLPFPHLAINDVSAYMIEDNGYVKSMINTEGDDSYIYSEVIEKITEDISKETNDLYTLNAKIRSITL
ncbi:MAG: ATP-binding protein [Treponema sp.]|jgi:predicted ATPase|nr:ATP-binding protein [Treponema sp.]